MEPIETIDLNSAEEIVLNLDDGVSGSNNIAGVELLANINKAPTKKVEFNNLDDLEN